MKGDFKTYTITKLSKGKNYFANGQLNHNTTPGGKALKHACSIMVEVGPMSGADNLILDAREEKQGHKIRAKITKNKVSSGAINVTLNEMAKEIVNKYKIQDSMW